jgi:hypothetical protein
MWVKVSHWLKGQEGDKEQKKDQKIIKVDTKRGMKSS